MEELVLAKFGYHLFKFQDQYDLSSEEMIELMELVLDCGFFKVRESGE